MIIALLLIVVFLCAIAFFLDSDNQTAGLVGVIAGIVLLLAVLSDSSSPQQPRTAGAAPPAGREIAVQALLCGVSEPSWLAVLQQTSDEIVRQGGLPMIDAGISEGCPGGFVEAYARKWWGRPGDLLVIVAGAGSGVIESACGERAGGCALLNGSVIFLRFEGNYIPGSLAHEAGHCFGLPHAPERDSDVMYPYAGFGTTLSGDYLGAMAAFSGRVASIRDQEAITVCTRRRGERGEP